MSKIPSVPYEGIVRALQRDGRVIVRQRGSHTRLQKHTPGETLKLVVQAHRPVKRSTPSHISEQARLPPGRFADLL